MLGAVTAKDWSDDYVDYVDKLPSFLDPFTSDIRDIRNDIAATAVSPLSTLYFNECCSINIILWHSCKFMIDIDITTASLGLYVTVV